ncbi:MAG: RdgB/HAM1 family non-canonical purine NTP pyrophosphatase [Acidimicrobiaceae bacterium]|nr:RdgB/HAM1 family non-canonical purine NTP pyrophosphatase [Acidimicrobiaceae bacterium]
MIELVCASANPDKVAEMAEVLEGHAVLLPRPAGVGEVVEDADTLEGNAILKARAVCEFAGAAALADDTGLEVDALGGAPGVYSARYAGPDASYADNLARLLTEMRDVPPSQRAARFRTVAAVCFSDGTSLSAEGAVDGVITTEPRGAGGFGYDPVFAPGEAGGLTFSEMGPAAKNAMSHRARALRALLELLRG